VIRQALAAVVGLGVLVGLAPPASADISPVLDPAAHAGEVPGNVDTSPYLGVHDTYRPSYMMIGDSITRASVDALRARGVRWEITSIPGRDVSTLPYYVRDRMMNTAYPLRYLVVALATNATPGWTKAKYAEALPEGVTVEFVTSFRDYDKFPATTDYRRRAYVQYAYSLWMKQLAAERPNTCVADWRSYAGPRRARVLRDGVHPVVSSIGTGEFSYLVVKASRGCV
jgi:hypothetical protein